MKSDRAQWQELNRLQKKVLRGHIGPDWLPQWFCNSFAKKFDEYFDMETQERHDFGYIVGGDEDFRKHCDTILLENLYRDIEALDADKKMMGFFVADVMHLTVRIFGRFSFKKREQPLTYPEVSAYLEQLNAELRSGKKYLWKHLVLLIALIPLALFFTSNYVIYKIHPGIAKAPTFYTLLFLLLFIPQISAVLAIVESAGKSIF